MDRCTSLVKFNIYVQVRDRTVSSHDPVASSYFLELTNAGSCNKGTKPCCKKPKPNTSFHRRNGCMRIRLHHFSNSRHMEYHDLKVMMPHGNKTQCLKAQSNGQGLPHTRSNTATKMIPKLVPWTWSEHSKSKGSRTHACTANTCTADYEDYVKLMIQPHSHWHWQLRRAATSCHSSASTAW